MDEATEQAVLSDAIEQPVHGQHRTSNELRKVGVFVSGSGVRSIWLRHNLENFKKRLKLLEAKVASDGIIHSDAQVAALEKKKHDDEACGERACPTKRFGYDWMEYYNNDRTHQGKMCCGRTPMDTLLDGKTIWAEKSLTQI